jgi:4-alpha-glucanotransferase
MSFAQRLGGVILHPTCLPGPHGSGDFGPAAFHFVDWLATAAQSAWQVLPLTPVGFGGSPYAGVSALAGSPQLVALEPLIERDRLTPIGAEELQAFSDAHVRFDQVEPWRTAKLRAAFGGFGARASAHDRAALDAFCREHAGWLDDYALFMALDAHFGARDIHVWTRWDRGIAVREPVALGTARAAFADDIRFWQFVQWCFRTQWDAIKRYANGEGIRIVGDLPIFVALHSVDCWARPDLFLLDESLAPAVVAGVPPDYFSPTGQRWGNPLYDWRAMERDDFAWWVVRLRNELARADLVRRRPFSGLRGLLGDPGVEPHCDRRPLGRGPGRSAVQRAEARTWPPARDRRGPRRDHA